MSELANGAAFGFVALARVGRREMSVSSGADMAAFRGARRHLLHPLLGESDLAERPKGESGKRQGGDADVLPEAEGEIAISLRIENRQGFLKLVASRDKFAREPMCRASDAMRDTRLAGLRPRRAVAQHRRRQLRAAPSSPRTKLPTHKPY